MACKHSLLSICSSREDSSIQWDSYVHDTGYNGSPPWQADSFHSPSSDTRLPTCCQDQVSPLAGWGRPQDPIKKTYWGCGLNQCFFFFFPRRAEGHVGRVGCEQRQCNPSLSQAAPPPLVMACQALITRPRWVTRSLGQLVQSVNSSDYFAGIQSVLHEMRLSVLSLFTAEPVLGCQHGLQPSAPQQ